MKAITRIICAGALALSMGACEDAVDDNDEAVDEAAEAREEALEEAAEGIGEARSAAAGDNELQQELEGAAAEAEMDEAVGDGE